MKLTDKFSGVKVFDIINRYNIETVEQAQSLTDEQLLKCRHVGPLFIKKLRSIQTEQPEAQKEKDWTCYEIWRPNIPANGCKEQCKECKDEQQNQPQPEKAQEEQNEKFCPVCKARMPEPMKGGN